MEIYKLEQKAVFKELGTSNNGLSKEEVAKRQEKYGPNIIEEVKGRSIILKFIENFYHLFAILLWGAAALSIIAGTPELSYAIVGVIIINAIFSFWQEFKAEKATEALKELLPTYAKVLREGEHQKILAKELVPGDMILLEEGDAVSADARVIENYELRTNDSALTGESHPRRKLSDQFLEKDVSVTDSPNLVFSGTSVVSGTGRALVYATGMKSEFGRIAYLTQSIKVELSPLQKEMKAVTRLVGGLAVGLGISFFFLGGLTGLSVEDRFVFAIGIIVANVPEGLLPTVTLSLALGVQRMVKRNALIKKLSSVETLGSTNVIATDKTGTLTENEMTVREIWSSGHNVDVSGVGYEPSGGFFVNDKEINKGEIESKFNMLFKTGALSNTAKLLPPNDEQPKWTILGDPTEAALLVAAEKGGFSVKKAHEEGFLAHQLPFESVRKRMSVIYRYPDKTVAYVKGAPVETLNLCSKIWVDGKVKKLDEKTEKEILDQNDDYAKRALRVLAFAIREIDKESKEYTSENVEKDLIFVGLMAMMDPPREEVAEAVKKAHTAGIKIIMITGDYGLTAESIARKIGIVEKDVRIITGVEIEDMSDDEVGKAISEQEVIFARVSPEHKMRVVSALKDKGFIVAVTGDGVNDAPALKRADIGVAMGIAGTDVAKEAADMILTDDNFASIVNAIEEGRAVFDNIRRFITYIFASNIPQIIPFILFVMFDVPLPLTVLQILAVDLGTDLVPALALGAEKPEPGIMERPPRGRKERLLNSKVLLRSYGFLGPIEAIAGFGAYYLMWYQNGFTLREMINIGRSVGIEQYSKFPVYIKATTMSLAAITTTQIGNGFAVRSIRESIFKIGFFTNIFFLWGVASEIVFILLFIYVPPFSSLFGLAPVGALNWVFLFALAPLPLIADEIRKAIVRRYYPAPKAK